LAHKFNDPHIQCYFYTRMTSDDRTNVNNWRVLGQFVYILRHIFETPKIKLAQRRCRPGSEVVGKPQTQGRTRTSAPPRNSHEPRIEHWALSVTHYLNPKQISDQAKVFPQFEIIMSRSGPFVVPAACLSILGELYIEIDPSSKSPMSIETT
jgi:hypothetical protein